MTMTIIVKLWKFSSTMLPWPHKLQGNIAKDMEKRNLDVFLTSEPRLQQLKSHTESAGPFRCVPTSVARFRRIGC